MLIDNLISYWKMDESSGSMLDSHGSHNGSCTNITYSASGKINTGYSFSGSSYVNFGDVSDFDFGTSTDFSISCWLKPTDSGADGEGFVISKVTSGVTPGWGIEIYQNKVFIFIRDGSGSGSSEIVVKQGATAINDGNYHHVVVTFDRDGLATIYVDTNNDGSVDISTVTDTISNTADLTIGYRVVSPQHLYRGSMDEICIFNRLLSTDDVAELNNAGAGLAYPFSVPSNTGNFLQVF